MATTNGAPTSVSGGPLPQPTTAEGSSNNPDAASPHLYFQMEAGDAPDAAYPYPPRHNAYSNDGNVDNDDDHLSVVSSVLTADGIHDVTGFCVVCFVILIGDMSRGVMFPTMWPLVEELGGTSVALGFSVAAFSGGRILVSPMFGSWSITWGYSKVLLLSASLLLLGTLSYAQVQNVNSVSFLWFSQLLLGVGSGTLGVTRAFVAEVTAQRNRTTYMAWITAVQYAGFTVTPFFGSLFIQVLGDRDYQYGPFRLNMFTAPAYFMSLVIILTLILLATLFQDRHRMQTKKDRKKKSARRTAIDELANSTTAIGLTVYDACIVGCMLLNVATKGSIASFETLGVMLASSHFNLAGARAGTIVATCGTLGVVSLLSMGELARVVSDIQLICGGMIVMSLGIGSLILVNDQEDEYGMVNNPTWRYILAIFMIYSVGYPIGHTAVIGLFSKIVGRRPQGTLMGWFASAGSLARIVFPIMSGYVAALDIVALFLILVVVLGIATIFVLASRKTLSMLSK